MVITVKNHSYDYDIENIGEIFFPYEKIKMCFGEDYPDDPITVKTEILGMLVSLIVFSFSTDIFHCFPPSCSIRQ